MQNLPQEATSTPGKDYLWLHIRELPYFRSLMRAVEASFYSEIELPNPVLDVGCGDGHFVTVAFENAVDVGIDPWERPLLEASNRSGYRLLIRSDGARSPFKDDSFGSAFSNSVLEHIPNVENVLQEIGRILKPGAPFVFCTPNQRFLEQLEIAQFFDRIHLYSIAGFYRSFFNRISRHYHCDSVEIWQERLDKAGFVLVRWWHYFPPDALHAMEWGHYFGLPSLIVKKLTCKWILVPKRWNLALIHKYASRHYYPFEVSDGVCTFYIARRKEASKL